MVIPKEIRKRMGAAEGTPLEIFTTSDGGVVFKKYMPATALTERIADMEMVVDDISEDLGAEKADKIQKLLKQIKGLCV